MPSLLVKLGLWLAGLGGWAQPVLTCSERHWHAADQLNLDILRQRAENIPAPVPVPSPPCALRHWTPCEFRHFTPDDQAQLDALHTALAQSEALVAGERLKRAQHPDIDPLLLRRAHELSYDMESKYAGGFGEAKRHEVYARLTKEFPQDTRRNIGLAIELSLPENP